MARRPTEATAGDFFSIDATRPAALGITSIQDPTKIGAGRLGTGTVTGHNRGRNRPNWGTGDLPGRPWQADRHRDRHSVARRPATGIPAGRASETSALTNRASSASVSLDEENVSLLTNQHAYQAAARVMTAVDEALDVLINRTGLVGR